MLRKNIRSIIRFLKYNWKGFFFFFSKFQKTGCKRLRPMGLEETKKKTGGTVKKCPQLYSIHPKDSLELKANIMSFSIGSDFDRFLGPKLWSDSKTPKYFCF